MLKTAVVNLGCPKNEVDAERLVYLLDDAGFELVDDPAAARIIIVNTCAFIQPAVEEAIETILELARYKQDGSCRILAVSGCLPQRYGAELTAEIPEIDFLFGVADWCRIPQVLQQASGPEKIDARLHIGPLDYRECQNLPQAVTPPGAFAYLKISEGCDNRCTYCMIPAIKGRQQSVPLGMLLEQARRLAAGGVRELNIVAQDITAYGRDLPTDNGTLTDLLEKLCHISELDRIRL
ncbi:MAG: radical SAM protein, partial [Deltaproteobacteria bacterium]|nr:radical SAM protein [Deltaproteobacteria bacterium]